MWSSRKRNRALGTILRFGRPHRRHFLVGLAATFAVVFFRLALPWPLRGVVEIVFPGNEGDNVFSGLLPSSGSPVLWLGLVYLLLALGSGVSELFQRVNLKKFAAYTVHDLRGAAVRGARRRAGRRKKRFGDLIARVVGDTARIKAGLSGILVHVLQNGLIFVGVCAILLVISVKLGLIFLIGGLLGIGIGLWSSSSVAETSGQARRKEGKYAVAIQEQLEHGGKEERLKAINEASAHKEVRSTRIIALSSLVVHGVVAATVALALWVGAVEVASGRVAPGELFLFVAYALTLHRRTVQIGRQSARSGKVMACAHRVGTLLDKAERGSARETAGVPPLEPLGSSMRFQDIKLKAGGGRRPRLRTGDLAIERGSRIAVVGDVGAGKSSLLEVLAGREVPDRGQIFWDDRELTDSVDLIAERTRYLSQEPVFPPTRIWKLLGLPGPDSLDPEQEETLRRLGAWKVIRSLPSGLLEKVGSLGLSRNEARALRLGSIVLDRDADLWLLDTPASGLRRKKAAKRLHAILERAGDRTVIAALQTPVALELFDRVIELRRGKIRFDGPPAQWQAREMPQETGAG